MEDYAALLNRVSKQLARSNFSSSSSKQPKTSSRRRQQNVPVTGIQKSQSGRNSPAARYNHRAPLNFDHVMPFHMQHLPETRDSLAGQSQQAFQLERPHSWHQSAFSAADYPQSVVSSSYPDDTFAWPITQPWNNNSHDLSPEAWSASSTFVGMNQELSPDGLYPFDDFGQAPGIFDGPPDSANHSMINFAPNLPPSDALLASDVSARHLSFDGFYGPTAQPATELGVPRQSSNFNMFNEPEATGVAQQHPVELLAAEDEWIASNDEELIGLGLYDKAEDTARQNQELSRQRPALLLGDAVQPTGKGLKLEETWQPPNETAHAPAEYDHVIAAELEDGYDDDDAGDSSNDGYDDEDIKNGVSVYEQQIATPIDLSSFSSFPLSQSEEQYFFGDVTGFADGLMDGQQKTLYGQDEYGYGWLGQNGPVQFI